jgi:ABC-type glycerol-3-phosphate transport system substrate-binding protein
MKKFTSILLIVLVSVSFSGCFKKDEVQRKPTGEIVELVYYKMFDDEDVIKPLIDQYTMKNPNVRIIYRKFTNLDEYLDLVLNELAEGEGPDIFSVPNYWPLKNTKKINYLPEYLMTTKQFEETFVSVAKKDLVLRDPYEGKDRIFGIPLMVDTLALYYNKEQFEDVIPSRGRPSETWDGIKEDVFALTKRDNSFERFDVSGIAMGRAENIARAVDILYLLMLQYKTAFYNENVSKAQFARQRSVGATGENINPASAALDLYTSFALPANKNYSWNAYLADVNSAEKEMETFVKGKVSMIFGYSYLYDQMKGKIKELNSKGIKTINESDIKVAPVPQVIDPKVSVEKRDAYASYFIETVGRTSKHADIAWDFLIFLSSKDNLKFYNEKTRRPTSRRDMIDEQKLDPLYGVFAGQIGHAESLQIFDNDKYNQIFKKAIDSVLATVRPGDAINTAEEEINKLLPPEGLIPPAPVNAGNENKRN